MPTLKEKSKALKDAIDTMFTSNAIGDERLEPGDVVVHDGLKIALANVNGQCVALKYRGHLDDPT